MTRSGLIETVERLAVRSASAVVARSRLNVPALNAALMRRLASAPGGPDSLIADPVFEAARVWQTAQCCLGDLAGSVLHPQLVAALDGARTERMPRDRKPFAHQLKAWNAAREGLSYLVTSGTGSGKTECFMVPVLDSLMRDPSKGLLTGVRAIIIYPLNALIESQRERLAAWTEALSERMKFALFNGETPERSQQITRPSAAAELGDRRSIRERPPAILVTNVTMLEYLLLRTQDRNILERSRGLLRWIVLDEAHGYVGAQAAEMALLLRRVRAAFGVAPDDVQLIATSATISEGPETETKLRQFVADLAGQREGQVRVIEGREANIELPEEGIDKPLDSSVLGDLPPEQLWNLLAPHPRLRPLRTAMAKHGVSLSDAGKLLFPTEQKDVRAETQIILDAMASARKSPEQTTQLLPWRANLFHRALGGLWVCIDPTCSHRDPELMEPDSGWGFGGVWLRQRDRCQCGAPAFELVACDECGTPHLRAGMEAGAAAKLIALRVGEIDDFAVDAEPEPERQDGDASADDSGLVARATVLLRPAAGDDRDRFVRLDSGAIFDNAPPEGAPWASLALIHDQSTRDCCAGAIDSHLQPVRFGPPFFLGNALPILLEALSQPLNRSGLPMGGRRAISFSDSRQGTARLAAKLQQEAERTLTRAFLYHMVQESRGPEGEERAKLERRLALFRSDPDEYADDIRRLEDELAGGAGPVSWSNLVDRLAQHAELRAFAGDVWRERARGGREMAEDPRLLAEMFLYRQLFRRPKVQNNPETMGMVRLAFPRLEDRARRTIPGVLAKSGVDADGWVGLALASIDFGFRDNLSINISPDWMVRWVTPRGGPLRAMCRSGLPPQDRPDGVRAWPGPRPMPGNPARLHRLVYDLIGGTWDNPIDQDRAAEVLAALWELITTTVARDVGGGAYRLDFNNAGVARLDQAWLCPVTRRVFGYSPAGRSPYDTAARLIPISLPHLPFANAGGLMPDRRQEMRQWAVTNPEVASLRALSLWTNLHDRAAEYTPFLRAQEHSAQIKRSVLQIYEELFKDGKINVLNCTTTMEMGVDIPNVGLVVNANVPPSVSNYRQRVGRAGRRGEAFAFATTFCRDLPWDQIAFDEPTQFLTTPIAAPAVRLDSPALVTRHVHAALLGTFLRGRPEGFSIRTSIGAFFGATDVSDEPVAPNAPVEAFISALRGEWAEDNELSSDMTELTRATVLDGRPALDLAAETAMALEALLVHWRAEHSELLAREAASSAEPEVSAAFSNRARRMRGEFLLSELARRGFTPAYGFPVDFVSFDHLSGVNRDRDGDQDSIAFGDRRGGTSRTLDVAIREYAPGAEVVVDGLVHLSEGVLPAWSASADASGLEDLQNFWECGACRAFGVARLVPETCLACESNSVQWHRTLRPSGFLGRRAPHTGYENLGHVPYQMPRVRAAGASWRALPDPGFGRLRADPDGEVISLSSGPEGCGYALCLSCGRAAAEQEETPGFATPPPEAIRRHFPLARGQGMRIVRGGYCPGGITEPQRVQRHVRFVHVARTDVFELQLAAGANRPAGLALAAALREALAERLGADTREIGVASGRSTGPAGDARVSLFLHDRAAGGAGLVSRLAEADWFVACVARAMERLHCPEDCDLGCPSCVLRPDLNFSDVQLDRPGGLALAETLNKRLDLPPALRVFGLDTLVLGLPLADWLEHERRGGRLTAVTLFLHGRPQLWDLGDWPFARILARMNESGIEPRLVIEDEVLTDSRLEFAQKLDLHRLASNAKLAYCPVMPMAGDALILAIVEHVRGTIAIAAPEPEEAVPGPRWGLGEEKPLVRGPRANLPSMVDFDSERLLVLSSGNARLIRLANHLDGPVADFGRAFWRLIAKESPLTVAAMTTHGVKLALYTDRYLMTPLNLRLLFEVLTTMPRGKGSVQLSVRTARLVRPERQGWAIYDSWSDDAHRRSVILALLPNTSIDVRVRTELPHARSLNLTLGDGRRVVLLLDQGFGAWRADGPTRHDFNATPAGQARALRGVVFGVRADATGDVPVILEDDATT